MAVEYGWDVNLNQWVPLAAAPDNSTQPVDPYGDHIIVLFGGQWYYRGQVITERPTGIAPYAEGGRAIWVTSTDETYTTFPTEVVFGDVWEPHGNVDPTL